ncbi:MAG: methyl-accepting chemotaxis protein [Eubacterium sp.]|nr:methyl-accepting chemotaxis protein [Eubacterium sp.]
MFKNMKLWLKISLTISILLIVGMAIILAITIKDTRSNTTELMEDRLTEMADSKATVFNDYCDSFIRYEHALAALQSVKDALTDPSDAESLAQAQSDVSLMKEQFDALEGFLVTDTASTIICHSNTAAIGSTIYTDDRISVLETIEENVLANDNNTYVRGIINSSSTGDLVFNAYTGIFNDAGNLIGYATGGFYVANLKEIIDGMMVEGLEGTETYVIDLNSNTYVMCEDEELLGTEVTDSAHLEAVNAAAAAESGTVKNAKGEDGTSYFMAFKKLESYNFLFVVSNPQTEVYHSINSMTAKLVVLIIAILLVLVLVTIFISRRVAGDINKVGGIVENIADSLDMTKGDELEKYSTRKDEVGGIAKSTLALTTAIRTTVKALQEHGHELSTTSENLADISGQTLSNVEQVETAVHDIAEGATSQAGETSRATTSVVEIGGQIQDATHAAKDIIAASEDMQKASKDVTEVIEKLTRIGAQTSEAIDKIYEQTNTTNASAAKIKGATELITSIAEETNLLSLNASIEAARAGEQGKGFAVVAAQIQKLAEQSSQSAQQIENIIATLIADSDEAVQTMAEVKEVMVQQSEYVKDTGTIFENVRQGIDQTILGIGEISRRTNEMDEARQNVVDVVESLSAIAEENAASTQETSASVTIVNNLMSDISDAATNVSQIAENMDKELAIFKI